MIVNNERGTFSKRYTDETVASLASLVEAKIGSLSGDSISAALGKKADALSVTPSDKVMVVTFNGQGLVTGGKELSSDGSLTIKDGVVSHAKWTEGLSNTSFGYGNYVPTIKVDEFGHIVSIENRVSYSITTAPQAGQVLRGDSVSLSYQPEDVDSEVVSGSHHLVTGDAVYKAISSTTSAMYRIMGSCTEAELAAKIPSVGDVWNITDGDMAGANYVWVGAVGTPGEAGYSAAHWDKLSETMDLSVFADKTVFETHTGKIASKDQWGHARTSDTIPLSDSIEGTAGTDNGILARADHSHPVVTGPVSDGTALPASGGAVFSAIQALEDRLFTDDGKIDEAILPATATGSASAVSGTITLTASGWVSAGDNMVQTVQVIQADGTAAEFDTDSSVFLNWDPTDYEPYDLGMYASSLGTNTVTFSYTAASGTPSKDFTVTAIILS